MRQGMGRRVSVCVNLALSRMKNGLPLLQYSSLTSIRWSEGSSIIKWLKRKAHGYARFAITIFAPKPALTIVMPVLERTPKTEKT